MRGLISTLLGVLCLFSVASAGGGGGHAVAIATPVITKATPVLVATKSVGGGGHGAHYLGYAGNVFEQLLGFSGSYALPVAHVFGGGLLLGHGGGGGGGGGSFLLSGGHGGGFGGGLGHGFGGGLGLGHGVKTYRLSASPYGIPVGLPVSLGHGWH
ncbi:secreted protein, putative [Ixodes scapularis]|uniref:Secreted protein, putative n=1 Tax=Ixodes scapularis TaxID=6945 RepID=B7PA75_IXOSC|nr:secreted protein, putative [Ixodes scapularis]|eukprot:XP_002406466.1 secreted protein, putative [Ixodes scapularis]